MSEAIEGTLLAGRYRVGAVIGSGGMSVVREAEDLRMSRQVALKFIKHDASTELTERLFREARAAARANHPAVVTVFGYGSDDETCLDYLVMERLEGEDVASRLRRQGPLTSDFVLALAIEIADALARVHEVGVVHRDLKPANVYLARHGRHVDQVKLLDFGVAKQVDLHTLTLTGQVVGTAAYMAPEQILDAKRVDPRSDVYAFGALLFECLSGRRPQRGDTVQALASRVLLEDGPDMDRIPCEVAPTLRKVIARCLRRRPDERYPNARSLLDALIAAQP